MLMEVLFKMKEMKLFYGQNKWWLFSMKWNGWREGDNCEWMRENRKVRRVSILIKCYYLKNIVLINNLDLKIKDYSYNL